MKRSLIAAAVLFAPALLAPAWGSEVTAAVQAWLGKWPNEPFNHQPFQESKHRAAGKDHRTFWQFPGTRTGLEAAVGKKRAALMIDVWRTGNNLKMAGPRWASYMTCMPHNCGGNEAHVFIDTVSGRFNVCWMDEGHSQWLAPGQAPLVLAEFGCNQDPAPLILRYGR